MNKRIASVLIDYPFRTAFPWLDQDGNIIVDPPRATFEYFNGNSKEYELSKASEARLFAAAETCLPKIRPAYGSSSAYTWYETDVCPECGAPITEVEQ